MVEPPSIDDIIGRVQEEIARRKPATASAAPPAPPAMTCGVGPLAAPPELSIVDLAVPRLRQAWRVGEELPPMHRQTGLRRRIAVIVGKLVLRLGQLVTRDQREFNQATLEAVEALAAAVRTQTMRWNAIAQNLPVKPAEPQLAQFRSRLDDVDKRAAEYLPALRAAKAGTATRPVLDAGSGDAWLAVLRDAGLVARAVDGDLLEQLRKIPDQSLGAVTGLQVVERLPFQTLLELFRESLRALAPGGVVIFETPNPENLLVGGSRFWLDPTRLRPLHPEALRFVVAESGFSQVEIRRLNPAGEQRRFADDALNQLFHGAQDYAVVAVRP